MGLGQMRDQSLTRLGRRGNILSYLLSKYKQFFDNLCCPWGKMLIRNSGKVRSGKVEFTMGGMYLIVTGEHMQVGISTEQNQP